MVTVFIYNVGEYRGLCAIIIDLNFPSIVAKIQHQAGIVNFHISIVICHHERESATEKMH